MARTSARIVRSSITRNELPLYSNKANRLFSVLILRPRLSFWTTCQRQKERERERKKERERERKRERETETERDRDRERDRQTDRKRK